MKNKPFYIVETGIEKLTRVKKEQEKMKDMADDMQEYMMKKQLENMPVMNMKLKTKK